MESTSLHLLTLLDRLKRTEYSDYNDIISWYTARRLPAPKAWEFSTVGFTVVGVAAGFLYTTNSGIAFLEGFITNPSASSKDRYDSLKAIRNALIHTASADRMVHKLCCTTKNRTIELLAKEVDFREIGEFKFLSKVF